MTQTNIENRRPILLSVVQYETELQNGAMTPADVIEKAVALGLDGIELRPGPWASDANQIAELRAQIEAHGLIVTYATMSTLFTPDKESLQAFARDVDVASALGSPFLRVFQGPPPVPAEQYYRSNQMALEGVVMGLDYARQKKVLVVLENAAPPSPGAALADVQEYLAQFWDAAQLQTNLDIGNYARANESVVAAIQTLGPRIVSTHLKDLPTNPDEPATYLGGGTLPLAAILDAFAALPQRILHVFEFAGGDAPDARIVESLRYLRARNGRI